MKKNTLLLLLFLLISSFPLSITTLVWILTLGAFDYLEAVHHGLFVFCTVICIIASLITLVLTNQEYNNT